MMEQQDDRLEFPDLEEEFGEIAVRDAVSTLNREALGSASYNVRDDTIKSRIRGIDSFERLRVFAAVENRTRGRESVLEHLRRRREQLEEIGERSERMADLEIERDDDQDDVDEEMDPEPVWIHEPCGAVAERESPMAWFCPKCEQRTNRVEEIDPATVDDPQPGTVVAEGGVA